MSQTAFLHTTRRRPESNWWQVAAYQNLSFVPASPFTRSRALLEDALAERDGGRRCFYCHRTFEFNRFPHNICIDHVGPRSAGGSDHIDNLVIACSWCNFEKSTAPAWYFVFRTAPSIPETNGGKPSVDIFGGQAE